MSFRSRAAAASERQRHSSCDASACRPVVHRFTTDAQSANSERGGTPKAQGRNKMIGRWLIVTITGGQAAKDPARRPLVDPLGEGMSRALVRRMLQGVQGKGAPVTCARCRGQSTKRHSASSDDRSTDLASLHVPVMLNEVLDLWLPKGAATQATSRKKYLVDGTIGLGGHTSAAIRLAGRRSTPVKILGVDRDANALSLAQERIRSDCLQDAMRVEFHRGSFADISPVLLEQRGFPSKGVDGIFIDLGINSMQIDDSSRGFSFRRKGPLDMRFNTAATKTRARDIVNGYTAEELALIFREHSDEPLSREIAAHIVKWRKEKFGKRQLKKSNDGIRTTLELRYAIEEAVELAMKPNGGGVEGRRDDSTFEKYRQIWHRSNGRTLPQAKKRKYMKQFEERRLRHPNHVMRVFQSLRIEVNSEIDQIAMFLQGSAPTTCLGIGGRLVMLAFHPGEDDLVRQEMARLVECGSHKLITPEVDGVRPTHKEVKFNGRSRTARLRAIERIM